MKWADLRATLLVFNRLQKYENIFFLYVEKLNKAILSSKSTSTVQSIITTGEKSLVSVFSELV